MDQTVNPEDFWQEYCERDSDSQDLPDGISGLRAIHQRYSKGMLQVLSDNDSLVVAIWLGDEDRPGLVYVLNSHDSQWRNVWVTTPWYSVEFVPVLQKANEETSQVDGLYSGSSGTILFTAAPQSFSIYTPVF